MHECSSQSRGNYIKEKTFTNENQSSRTTNSNEKDEFNVFTLTVPGTPDQDTSTKYEQNRKRQDKEEDLTLYYTVFQK